MVRYTGSWLVAESNAVLGPVQGLRLALAVLRPLRGAFGALDRASARRWPSALGFRHKSDVAFQ